MPSNSVQLNDRQLRAVQFGNFPLLVLAGAGTGKTTTIVERIAYSISNNSISPNKILALTFSVDAALNLKNRLSEKNIENSDLINACTFHSFAKDIIDANYSLLGYPSEPSLISKDESVYLYSKRISKIKKFKSRLYNRFPLKAIKSILSIHDQFKQELFNAEDLKKINSQCFDKIDLLGEDDSEPFRQLSDAIDVFDEFNEIKKSLSFIEYEDMIYGLWGLINSSSDILKKIQRQFEFIIIDEFQDNNFAFSEIVYKIANHNNITVVGDDDQSIYSFRGANSQNIVSFDEYYRKIPDYQKVELATNYRSSQPILDIANSVIINNQNRMDKEPLMSNSSSTIDSPVHLHIGDRNSQFAQILDLIDEFSSNKDGDLAILCRTNFDCSAIAEILDKEGILHTYSNSKLFNQRIVKDAVALLNLISNSKYNLHSFLRLAKNRFSDHFKNNIIRIWKQVDDKNTLNACLDSKGLFSGDEYAWISDMASMSDNASKYNILDCISSFLRSNYDLSDLDRVCLNNFSDIFKKFYNIHKNDNLSDFCDYVNLLADNNSMLIDTKEACGKPIVALMTVHSSKGMEFKHVILPFLQSAKFPQSFKNPKFLSDMPINLKKWANDDSDSKTCHIDEERRLFYVACTRAESRLDLLTTPQRQSMFIKELNEELYSQSDIQSNRFISISDDFQENFKGPLPFDKLRLSASKIDTYNRCQLKYKYSNIDLIPQTRYNSVFALGNVVHKVLQDFHENKFNSFDDASKLLAEHWNSNLYFYKCESDQYYSDASDMLKKYCDYLEGNPASPVLFEAFFEINMNDYVLSGIIDRIDVDSSGNIKIYDYKTSASQNTENKLKKSFQLPIYALAVYSGSESLDVKIKSRQSSIMASELSLRFDDMERTIELKEVDIEDIKDRVSSVAKQISSNVFKANPNMINCSYCDYKRFICSYYDD